MTLGYVLLLALPLLIVLAVPSIALGTIVTVYLIGLVADVLAALAWLVVALTYARRARNGELFGVPVVTAIVDRLMRDAPPG